VCVNSSYASLARKVLQPPRNDAVLEAPFDADLCRLCCSQTLDELKASSKAHVKVCCVVGFPLGACTTSTKAFEAQQCLDAGAEEIDMVINVGMLLAEEYDFVLRDICAVVAVCKERGALSKVILETALLNTEQIRKASELAIAAGADFIKTSTGFSTRGTPAIWLPLEIRVAASTNSVFCACVYLSLTGASEEDVKLMASIAKPAGKQVKASGGIRSATDAEKMIALGATRLGTSAGVKIAQGQQSTEAY
jgi:deoxyribose-phosphate aldolase